MANCMEPNFKHHCRVCKKGFMCGRALGGHMRAHGIGDDQNGNFDEDRVSDWEEKLGGISYGTNNKRMYQLRTNPNRLKSSRNCENCGKEFLCWKSFLEHGKCSSDDASKSLIPSSESEDDEDDRTRGSGWSKRKRSLRAKVGSFNSTYPSSTEDEDLILAKCLVQLANSGAYPVMDEPEESCTSASREEERRNSTAYLGPLMSRAPYDKAKGISKPAKGLFECKACKKVFNSHQALGGHRASHKKVKGCFATKQDQVDDNNLTYDMFTQEELFPTKSTNSSSQFEQGPAVLVGAARRKSKVHECTICHRVFSSGQALGGHKRCHWITSNSRDTSSLPKFHFQVADHIDEPMHHHYQHQDLKIDKSDTLDLNVPVWAHNGPGLRRDPHNPLSFDVSTDIDLRTWIDHNARDDNLGCHSQHENQQHKNGNNVDSHNNVSHEKINDMHNIDDEADSKLKLAKLSELNDLKNMDTCMPNSSQWLQVGIGSTTEATTNVP